MNLTQLTNIAIKAALSAGKVIQEYMDSEILVEKKNGGTSYASKVVTTVDRECEIVILSHLFPTCKKFDLAFLSEETADNGSRFEKDFFWCIDPMDGTLSFINKQPGFSVSIALVAKDGTPYIGVVYDPSRDILYYGIKGNGVFKNGRPWEIKYINKHLTYVTDRKLIDTPSSDKIEKLLQENLDKFNLSGLKEISGSGAVVNGILVLENGPACMVKLPKKEIGGGSIWDFAATACIYRELGLSVTDFKGEMLDLNKKDGTFMNKEGIFFANFTK